MPIFTAPLRESNDCHDPATGEFCSTLSNAVLQKVARHVRLYKQTKSYLTVKEFAEEFDLSTQKVKSAVAVIQGPLRARGIELTYEPSVRSRGTSGRNAFGSQGRATSTRIEARVRWRLLRRGE